jgi:hypothetical protein
MATRRSRRASSMARGGIAAICEDALPISPSMAASREASSELSPPTSEGMVRCLSESTSDWRRLTGSYRSVYLLRMARSSASLEVSSLSVVVMVEDCCTEGIASSELSCSPLPDTERASASRSRRICSFSSLSWK